MSKIKKLLDKKKQTQAQVVTIIHIDEEKKDDIDEFNIQNNNNNEEEINIIKNLEQLQVENEKKDQEEKQIKEWNVVDNIYREIDVQKQVQQEMQQEQKNSVEPVKQQEKPQTFAEKIKENLIQKLNPKKAVFNPDDKDFLGLDATEEEIQQYEKEKELKKQQQVAQQQIKINRNEVVSKGPTRFTNANINKDNSTNKTNDEIIQMRLQKENALNEKQKQETLDNLNKPKFDFRSQNKSIQTETTQEKTQESQKPLGLFQRAEKKDEGQIEQTGGTVKKFFNKKKQDQTQNGTSVDQQLEKKQEFQ